VEKSSDFDLNEFSSRIDLLRVALSLSFFFQCSKAGDICRRVEEKGDRERSEVGAEKLWKNKRI
jgi:hypothetical protein